MSDDGNHDHDDHHRDDDDHRGDDHRGGGGDADKPKKPGSGDYVVGYKRPPKHSQYKPGESGNRNGRKEGSKNTATLLAEELNRRTNVTESGKQQHITKRHVIVKRTVNAAMGDAKVAIAFLQQLMRGEGTGEQSKASVPFPSGPEQDRIIEEFLRAVRASADPDADASDGDDDEGHGGNA